jgi:toxin ParE1/3/4
LVTQKVRLTPRARDDLKSIGRYTEGRFGRPQRNRYIDALYARFEWLADNPGLGRRRADVAQDVLCFPEGAHIVFYRSRSGGIDVIAILHQAMDVEAAFASLRS